MLMPTTKAWGDWRIVSIGGAKMSAACVYAR